MDQTFLDRIRALEAENVELRTALQSKEQNERSYEKLSEKYDEVSKANRRLKENLKKFQAKAERANETAQAAKQVVKQWKAFCDHQAEKFERAGLRASSAFAEKDSSPPVDRDDPSTTPRPLPTHNALDSEVVSAAAHALRREGLSGPHDRRPENSADASGARSRRITSSQTTEDGAEIVGGYDPCVSSDDEPEFVSARPVKRRRGNSPAPRAATQIKPEPTSPSQPHEINSEDYSSPVVKRRQPPRRETSNLDAITEAPTSPRTRTRRRAVSVEAPAAPRMPATTSSLSESDRHHPIKEEPEEEPGGLSMTSTRPRSPPDTTIKAEGSDVSQRALQPLSNNVARSPRHAVRSTTKRKRKSEEPKARLAKAAVVSEDGDMDSSQLNQTQPDDTPTTAINRRLDSLLDGPAPSRQRIDHAVVTPATKPPHPRSRQLQFNLPESAAPKAAKKSAENRQQHEQRPVFRTPDLALKSPLTDAPATAARRGARLSPSPPPPDPDDEPLRARPVSKLRVEDFRINPKYQGTDFAFADTLRGRDQRRCLPGCTRPECCGDTWRKAAEMGLKGSKTDDEVLEMYLGPAWESHMAAGTPAERRQFLTEARTYAMAKEHGKHRSAFKRRTTPPGFWRIDMASTQEEQEDREKAQEMVRQEIYERWQEAMKPGGRYKFRDE